MKRLWIGIVFLSVILAIGICVTAAFTALHKPLSDTLQQASEAAISEDRERVSALTGRAKVDWERFRAFTAAVADHEPLEEMDAMFAQLEVLARQRETSDFAALSAQLSRMAQAMADSQSISWWNLL